MFSKTRIDPVAQSITKIVDRNRQVHEQTRALNRKYGVEHSGRVSPYDKASYDAELAEINSQLQNDTRPEVISEKKTSTVKRLAELYLGEDKAAFREAARQSSIDETRYEHDIKDSDPVRVRGIKQGMKSSKQFDKKFKTYAHFQRWAESDAAADHNIHQVEKLGHRIDEISSDLKKRYINKAVNDVANASRVNGTYDFLRDEGGHLNSDSEADDKYYKKMYSKRRTGIKRALKWMSEAREHNADRLNPQAQHRLRAGDKLVHGYKSIKWPAEFLGYSHESESEPKHAHMDDVPHGFPEQTHAHFKDLSNGDTYHSYYHENKWRIGSSAHVAKFK